MKFRFLKQVIAANLVCVTFFPLAGCSETASPPADATTVSDDHADHDHADHSEHEHGEWWCAEHGVPEAECALCDKSLVADFKAKDDWCEEHNRPDSQCFVCHPENFEKFAALYEAKFGERPEMPTE